MCPRLDEFAGGLSPTERNCLEGALRLKGCTWDTRWDYFTPLTPPILAWPRWADELALRTGVELPLHLILDACEAAIMGVLYARIQDAAIDGHGLDPVEAMVTADSCFARHLRLIQGVSRDNLAFCAEVDAVWSRYRSALLFERKLVQQKRPIGKREFERILDHSRPVFLPGAAILVAAGLDAMLGPAATVVDGIVRAGQLFDDTIDATEDAANGNATFVLHRLGAGDDDLELHHTLYVEGAFDQILEEACAELERAAKIADDTDMPNVARDVRKTRGSIDLVRADVVGTWLRHAVGN